MKKNNGSERAIVLACILCWAIAGTYYVTAAPLKSARVSQVIQDVRLLKPSAAPRPATVNDQVIEGTAVRTGVDSRVELTFPDLTITRLGQNTIFTLSQGTREVRLDSGSILVQIPPNAPPATIKTAAVTAAITGGTAMLSVDPPKFMVLEGTGTFFPVGHPEEAVELHGGEMVILTPDGHVSQVMKFNVKLVLGTSHLIIDFPDLANLPLILNIANRSLGEEDLVPGLNALWKDAIDTTDQNTNANPEIFALNSTATPTPTATPSATPTPGPSATPSEFGPPSTISSPVPYVINSNTVITTDPSITTNGVTNFGKIYRGPTDDGPFTIWAYGSTRPFDTGLNLDTDFFADPTHLPIAVFKFQSLSLNGDPIIDTTNGVTHLGLIGVNGITSGPPGGMLTFAGLDQLYLGTVNGSIDLTSDISFAKLGVLGIYARGSGSSLTINSPISNIGRLALAAEGSLQLTNPGSMSVGRFGSTAGGNLNLQIGGSLTLNDQLRLDALVLPGTTVANGANVTLNVGNNLTNSSASDSKLRVRNTSGQIDNGGNITVMVNGSISTGGPFSVLVENYDFSGNTPGRIGTGGNISVTTGGNFSAQSIIALVNNRSGGQIGSSVSLTLSIGGALTTSGESTDPFEFPESLSAAISTRFDNLMGNPAGASTIDGDATLTINASSASIGGHLSTTISNTGGILNGSALLNLGITHNVSIQGEAVMQILNDADIASPLGGMLHGSATLQVHSNNFTANALFAQIDNRDAGVIDSNASLTFNLTGSFAIPGTNPGNPDTDATVPGEADIFILNQIRAMSQDSATTGGTIGGNASIQLSAASASTAGDLDVWIDNSNNDNGVSGGSIGGNATINLDITGNLSSHGPATFRILNQSNVVEAPGGTITGNAAITLQAANMSVGTALAPADLNVLINNLSGNIGGSTTIDMDVSGTATLSNNANISIANDPVSKAAEGLPSTAINFNGGTYNVTNEFRTTISNDGAITFNNAIIQADVLKAGVFGFDGAINVGGGTLSATSELKLYAPGGNGQINFTSDVTLGGAGIKILAAHSITIFNLVTVHVEGSNPVDVYVDNDGKEFLANYSGWGGNGSTSGTFDGAGANDPQDLSNAPPFDDGGGIVTASAGTSGVASSSDAGTQLRLRPANPHLERGGDSKVTNGRIAPPHIKIANTAQLLSMLDDATPGSGGKISVAAVRQTTNTKSSPKSGVPTRGQGARARMDLHRTNPNPVARQ